MAYDPEARRKGNSALTIGLVALGLLGVGALAYVLTQPNNAETGPTTVVTTSPKTEVVEKEVPVPVVVPAQPAPSQPSTVVVQSPPASSTTTTSSTTVTSQAAPRPAAPAQSAPAQGSTTNNTTVNVEAPPAPAASDSSETTPAADESVAPGANTAPSSP